MKALVGYTGFVGSNIMLNRDIKLLYNSKNISDSYGKNPDILYYSGVKAEKYIANKNPDSDYKHVLEAINNINLIAPKSIVLISTADVYPAPFAVDEKTVIEAGKLSPYGLHRYLLEKHVCENIRDHLIVRFPGLYGANLKKNFIYDMIHFLPSILSETKIYDLGFKYLSEFYLLQDNGYYRLKSIGAAERKELVLFFNNAGFSALSFTDSRSVFQFFNLSYINNYIEKARESGIRLINIVTAPCQAGELYEYIFEKSFINEHNEPWHNYNIKSIYAEEFGGTEGYLIPKEKVMKDIKNYVLSERKKLYS